MATVATLQGGESREGMPMRRTMICAALAGVAFTAGPVSALTSGAPAAPGARVSGTQLADLEPTRSLSIASRILLVAANGAGDVLAQPVIRDQPAVLGGPRLELRLAPGEKAPTVGDYRGVVPIIYNYN